MRIEPKMMEYPPHMEYQMNLRQQYQQTFRAEAEFRPLKRKNVPEEHFTNFKYDMTKGFNRPYVVYAKPIYEDRSPPSMEARGKVNNALNLYAMNNPAFMECLLENHSIVKVQYLIHTSQSDRRVHFTAYLMARENGRNIQQTNCLHFVIKPETENNDCPIITSAEEARDIGWVKMEW